MHTRFSATLRRATPACAGSPAVQRIKSTSGKFSPLCQSPTRGALYVDLYPLMHKQAEAKMLAGAAATAAEAHCLFDEGQRVGPDLTHANRKDLRKLRAILQTR